MEKVSLNYLGHEYEHVRSFVSILKMYSCRFICRKVTDMRYEVEYGFEFVFEFFL